MYRRIMCVALLFLMLMSSALSKKKSKKPNEKKPKKNTKPYGNFYMEDIPYENTLHGFNLRRNAILEADKILRHKKYEGTLQLEEDDCLEFLHQCHAAKSLGIAPEEVVVPEMCIEFLQNFNIAGIMEHGSKKKRRKRFIQGTGGTSDTLRWEKCKIRYNMANITDATHIKSINKAMNKYEYWTSFKFYPNDTVSAADLNLTHSNYLKYMKYFTGPKVGCWSFVGNLRQSIEGQKISCCTGLTCVHELGHAVGAHHTQASPNRDMHVRVNFDYIMSSWQGQYYKKSANTTAHYSRYDYSSLMSYGLYASGNQGLMTLLPLDSLFLDEIINTDVNGYYLHKAMEEAYGCAATNCPSVGTCQNDGYVSQMGYDDQCTCRCCEGLDPATNCATIYDGDSSLLTAEWWGGFYSILKVANVPCPTGFNEAAVTQYTGAGWVSSDNSVPYNYDEGISSADITHNFCTSDGVTNGAEFPKGEYCILAGNATCPTGFESGYIQYADVSPPLELYGDLPYGDYSTDLRLYFCCRDDGNFDDAISMPTGQPFILFQKNSKGCQYVTDMLGVPEYYGIQNNQAEASIYEVSGSVPYITYSNAQSKYTVNYCFYDKFIYNCGDVINLDSNNNYATIQTPNYPNNYPNLQRCSWLIKSPPGTQILVEFVDFLVEDTGLGTCADYADIRHNGCGATGNYICGTLSNYGIKSKSNSMTILFGSDMTVGKKGFNATLTLVNQNVLRYYIGDYGRSYRGNVSWTRTFRPCVKWSEVSHCPHNPFTARNLGRMLEHNYCRNPDNGYEPWCYYDAYQCKRDACDVSILEPCYDISTECANIDCSEEEVFRVCNKKCSCTNYMPGLPGDAVSTVICPAPPDLEPEASDDALYPFYYVGEQVKYTCNGGSEFQIATCMTDGTWSPHEYVCNSCSTGWLAFNGACYKYFEEYMLKPAAVAKCSEYNAVVASAKTAEENAFLEFARDGYSHGWIGLLYDPNTNRHYWQEDGSDLDYENWNPNTYGKKGGYAFMGRSGQWEGANTTGMIFKGVFCKMIPSSRVTCVDRSPLCVSDTEDEPSACVDNLEYRQFECAVTCGYCVPAGETAQTCDQPTDTGNVALVTGGSTIATGEVYVYQCNSGYALASGKLVRLCRPDGTLTGGPPDCQSTSTLELPVNKESMVERKNTFNAQKAYLALNELHTIQKDGKLTKWEFYSAYSGNVGLHVWEATTDPEYFKLIGRTKVVTTGDGRKRAITLTSSQQITVKVGQVIGMALTSTKPGMVYDSCSPTLNGPYGEQKVSVDTKPYYGNWKVNKQYKFKNVTSYYNCRIWSFNAWIL